MTATGEYHIEIVCDDKRWWCFNAVMMCGCHTPSGERHVISARREIAPAGSNLKRCPQGVDPTGNLALTAPDCQKIDLYMYITPHTLPDCKSVSEAKHLNLDLRISRSGKLLLSKHFDINPWSGISVELKHLENGQWQMKE